MRRIVLALTTAAALMAMTAVAAFADQPLANKGSNTQGSTNGLYSSQVIHNGPVVREQAKSGQRATLVQSYVATPR